MPLYSATHVFPDVEPTVADLEAKVLETDGGIGSDTIVGKGLLLVGERSGLLLAVGESEALAVGLELAGGVCVSGGKLRL